MAIIHIFKDGTTATELVDVYVPKDIVERVVAISQSSSNEGRSRNEKKEH